MGCTHSSQAVSPPPSQSGDASRFASTSTAGITTDRPNAPLRIPGSSLRGPNTPRTRQELDRERQAFFDTRVSGRPEIWQAVQLAVTLIRDEHDLATAQGVLDASGITVPRGRLEDGLWDEQGHLYRLEPWILSDPEDLAEDDEEADIDSKDIAGTMAEPPSRGDTSAPSSSAAPLKIKCRLSDRGTDLTVALDKNERVKVLAAMIMKEAQLAPGSIVKLAYLGRVLRDHDTLGNQGWQEGHIISAFVVEPG